MCDCGPSGSVQLTKTPPQCGGPHWARRQNRPMHSGTYLFSLDAATHKNAISASHATQIRGVVTSMWPHGAGWEVHDNGGWRERRAKY